ncbi:ATP-binding protein [Aliikangiella sp. G2MR2-5]|uniref:ATP-binding protein n=1 Tax=Aliikangiella sp. G2MR2-5 TaxID=2788943 RepID=UPI0018A902FC|nr:ATP-binding protein [Aliikangiella sp. G2MR2-5]
MLHVGQFCQPFNQKSGCGDFIIHVEENENHLLVVGDVGGHGLRIAGMIADEIQDVVIQNASLPITRLFSMISKLPSLKKQGLALFVGRIKKNIPMLSYQCVGNLQLIICRNESVIQLKRQEGLLGLLPPDTILSNATKLKHNDYIFLSTDGVKSAIKNAIASLTSIDDEKLIAKKIVEDYGTPNDDAACLFAKYSMPGTIDSVINYPSENKEILPIKVIKPVIAESGRSIRLEQENAQKVVVQDLDFIFKNYSKNSSLDNELIKSECFLTLHYSPLIDRRLNDIFDFLDLSKKLKCKLITVLIEVARDFDMEIRLYLKGNYLYLQFSLEENMAKKIFPIFGKGAFFYRQDSKQCVIQVRLEESVDTSSKELENIREMVQFGLDKKSYSNFKDHQKKDKLISQQAKLASMGEMIGAIAHQWRQPINEIAIRIQKVKYMYKHQKVDEAYIDDFVSSNLKTINFMSKTIDDFRNFFRTDKEKELFKISEAIQSVISMQRAQLARHKILVNLDADNFQLNGYYSEFQQVILNLISNAKDAFIENNIEERRIDILSRQGLVVIEDNAGGIPELVANRIFEPYFTTKSHGNGTGMGLYISKTIVDKNMGGSLTYAPIDNGTRFSVNLVA